MGWKPKDFKKIVGFWCRRHDCGLPGQNALKEKNWSTTAWDAFACDQYRVQRKTPFFWADSSNMRAVASKLAALGGGRSDYLCRKQPVILRWKTALAAGGIINENPRAGQETCAWVRGAFVVDKMYRTYQKKNWAVCLPIRWHINRLVSAWSHRGYRACIKPEYLRFLYRFLYDKLGPLQTPGKKEHKYAGLKETALSSSFKWKLEDILPYRPGLGIRVLAH